MKVQLKNNPMSYTGFFYTVHLIYARFEALKNCQILFVWHCISAPDNISERFLDTHISSVFWYILKYDFNVV